MHPISAINPIFKCTKKIKAEGSTLDPLGRVEVPGGDVSKNLRNLGNSQEELSVSLGTFLHPTKTKNIWMDSRRFPGPPAASQTLRAWPWEGGSSWTQKQNKVRWLFPRRKRSHPAVAANWSRFYPYNDNIVGYFPWTMHFAIFFFFNCVIVSVEPILGKLLIYEFLICLHCD